MGGSYLLPVENRRMIIKILRGICCKKGDFPIFTAFFLNFPVLLEIAMETIGYNFSLGQYGKPGGSIGLYLINQ